jgi:hypothetical protein
MIRQRAHFAALLLIVPGFIVQAATTMLWFGNSYTEAGRQWGMLPKMINCTSNCGTAEPSNMTIAITTELVPSCWLDCHETNGAFNKIDQGHYNLVFAQGSLANWLWRDYAYGTNLLNNSTQMVSWANHARSAGGKLVIEQMWIAIGVPDHCDETQTRSDWWYDSITTATNSIMVPSGHAWYAAYKERPNLEYIDPAWNDGCHPGRFGAYLNVCCQYAALTGRSPVGSTWHKVHMGDTITLTDDEALFAQQKAWEAYLFFKSPTAVRSPVTGLSQHQKQTSTWEGGALFTIDGRIVSGDLIKSGKGFRPSAMIMERMNDGRLLRRLLKN